MPLSLAMDNSEFNHDGGSGGIGSLVAAAVAVVVAVAAVDNRDRWKLRMMVVAALGRGYATTSQRSKRAAQWEDKRVAQGR